MQLAADNPGQMALLASGAYLAGGTAARLFRPRGPLELAALLLVLQRRDRLGAAETAVLRGNPAEVRDQDGWLHYCPDEHPAG